MDIESLKAALDSKYQVERVLGQGGMATVFLARDVKLDRDVAIKVLSASLAGDAEGSRSLNAWPESARH